MKILNSTAKNFDKSLDSLLLERKKKLKSSSVSVSNIIKDVKKNGDKALSPFFFTSLMIFDTDTELDFNFFFLSKRRESKDLSKFLAVLFSIFINLLFHFDLLVLLQLSL